ncbi:MAG: CPBP family intramembrane metalloprotease [Saprospiraceae bacterium]|nr:CPBP family intramembrane metalloprotease [Saprospiraceae bacterium]
MSFADTVKDFLFFLMAPTALRPERSQIGLSNIIGLFLIIFFADLILFGSIMHILGIDQMDHKIDKALVENGKIFIIIAAVIVAPLTEEFLFRFPLRHCRATFFLLTTSFIYILLEGLNLNIHVVLNVIIVLFVATLLTLVIMDKAFGWWERIFKNYFPLIFYYVVAVFAFLHIYNFDISTVNWYYAPFMVIPQFILGIYLGYVRLRNNIWSSVLIHAINNIIPLILFFSIGVE